MNKQLHKLFKFVENHLGDNAKLAIGLTVVSVVSILGILAFSNSTPMETTVKITNLGQTHGGSGVIMESNSDFSLVLTNAHVCGVVKKGGLVVDSVGIAHSVFSYRVSATHDLCLIKVLDNLHVSTKVASKAPDLYSPVLVSGHPRLLPTIMTEGHLSKNIIVPILMELKKCTEEDLKSPNVAAACFFLGGRPIVKFYEATVVSALIQPGSSGSQVLNKNRELVGLIFAGSNDLSFGLEQSFGALTNFLNVEVNTLVDQKPNYEMDLTESNESTTRSAIESLIGIVCDKTKYTASNQPELCEAAKRSLWLTDL